MDPDVSMVTTDHGIAVSMANATKHAFKVTNLITTDRGIVVSIETL